ncbi:hypothetical protein ACF0H5_017196 [Mactra antiquata]
MNVCCRKSLTSSVPDVLMNRILSCNSYRVASDIPNGSARHDDDRFDLQKSERFCEGQFGLCKLPKTVRVVQLTFVRTFHSSHTCLTAQVDMKKNYYTTLGVTPQCSGIKIKQAYYRLSKIYHPDVNKTESAVIKFHDITEAYEILSSPSLRHQYDTGRRGHGHGIHRGTHRPGPVNFKARGPHQQVRTDHFNYDEWLKEHYSESFKEHQERLEKFREHRQDMRKKEELQKKQTPSQNKTQDSKDDFDAFIDAILKQAFNTIVLFTIFTLIYNLMTNIFGKKKR